MTDRGAWTSVYDAVIRVISSKGSSPYYFFAHLIKLTQAKNKDEKFFV